VEQRISHVTLGVANLKCSSEFYQRLGWNSKMNGVEGIVFFQLGGMALSLVPTCDLAADATVPSEGSGFRRVSLGFSTRRRNEVDEVLAEAEAAGATIVKRGQHTPWGGYSGYFADLDGFLWEVGWNPRIEMASDGSIHLPD
jgi:predicted lactoylglutathione lyase